jgi:hypothetical protein
MTQSPFSAPVAQKPPQPWPRWEANKHLVYLIGQVVAQIATKGSARDCAKEASAILTRAVALHAAIAASGLQLADGTSNYQANWVAAVDSLLSKSEADYDYLEMLS